MISSWKYSHLGVREALSPTFSWDVSESVYATYGKCPSKKGEFREELCVDLMIEAEAIILEQEPRVVF